jgi:DNA-binding transcriptional ArsR family regulator
LLRSLDRRRATVLELAGSLGESAEAVHAHLAVLYRAGIVRRADDEAPAVYELADWPSLWLVDQLAFRLRHRALEDADGTASEESPSCV